MLLFTFVFYIMRMEPREFGDHHFNTSRLYDAELNIVEGEVIFEIELRLRHLNQKFFFGLVSTPDLSGMPEGCNAGIGISIDPETGEVNDEMNGQGIIGYLEDVPMEENEPIFLCIEVEKLNRIFIPKITVGEEKVLHPALHLEHCEYVSLMVGSTDPGSGAVFENPHLVIASRKPRISSL